MVANFISFLSSASIFVHILKKKVSQDGIWTTVKVVNQFDPV